MTYTYLELSPHFGPFILEGKDLVYFHEKVQNGQIHIVKRVIWKSSEPQRSTDLTFRVERGISKESILRSIECRHGQSLSRLRSPYHSSHLIKEILNYS